MAQRVIRLRGCQLPWRGSSGRQGAAFGLRQTGKDDHSAESSVVAFAATAVASRFLSRSKARQGKARAATLDSWTLDWPGLVSHLDGLTKLL
jgi:hypothetical protein